MIQLFNISNMYFEDKFEFIDLISGQNLLDKSRDLSSLTYIDYNGIVKFNPDTAYKLRFICEIKT